MTQPWDPRFQSILHQWWQEFNSWVDTELPLTEGTRNPMRDWLEQGDSDLLWYYPLDDWDFDELVERINTVIELPGMEAIGLVTALSVTARLNEDLLHELEIPGIWLVRVQKT